MLLPAGGIEMNPNRHCYLLRYSLEPMHLAFEVVFYLFLITTCKWADTGVVSNFHGIPPFWWPEFPFLWGPLVGPLQ